MDGAVHYFNSDEGKRHERNVDIVSGPGTERDPLHYAVIYPLSDKGERYTRLFWRPHLNEAIPTHIAYGLPLFTRSLDHEVFTRRITHNFDRETAAAFPTRRVCYPFVTLGDVLCTIELTHWLNGRGIKVNSYPYKADSKLDELLLHASEGANVIVVGSTRVNGILHEYQRHCGLPYRLQLRDVMHVGHKKAYKELRPLTRISLASCAVL